MMAKHQDLLRPKLANLLVDNDLPILPKTAASTKPTYEPLPYGIITLAPGVDPVIE